MGWFKRSVQPQPVLQATNPLFVPVAASPAQPPAEQQQQQPRNSAHQEHADSADGQSVQGRHSGSAWESSTAQHCAGMACAPAPAHCRARQGSAHLRSPAGLGQTNKDSSAQHAAHAVGALAHAGHSNQLSANSSAGTASGRTSSSGSMRGNAPARLLLPADQFSSYECAGLACAEAQGVADEACYTPGAVGSVSQAGTLHVPAGNCKPQRPVSAAAGSARVSFDTSASQHSTQPSVTWQEPGHRGSSSPGCCRDADGGTRARMGCAANSNSALAGSVSGDDGATAMSIAERSQQQQQQRRTSSRPASALQRQVQLQLAQQQQQQQQQQGNTNPAAAAASAAGADEDDLLADMCASLDSLQAAAQLARTESGLKSNTLPAALAVTRASKDGTRRRSSSSSRPSSASTSRSSLFNSGGSAAAPVSAAAAGVQRISSSSTTSSSADSAAVSGSSTGVRQLDRGRSRLQASTSSACMFEEDCEDSEAHLDCGAGIDSCPGLRHVSTSSSSSGGLVMLKVGPNGATLCLTDGTRHAGLSRHSSGGSSSGILGGSSRESSVHKGVRSTSSIDSGSSAPVSASKSQEQQQQQQQKVLLLQQEQQRLQERRQHKQEQVLASYSCLSPSSPTAGARRSFDSGSRGNRGSSRPSSGHVTLAVPQHGTPDSMASRSSRGIGGGAGWSISAWPAGGDGGSPEAAATVPSQCSIEDAWAAATAAPKAAGMRPASAQQAAGPASPLAAQGSSASLAGAGGTMTGAGAFVLQQTGLRTVSGCAVGSLQVPLLPGRALSAGAACSPRHKGATAAAAAAAAAGMGLGAEQDQQHT